MVALEICNEWEMLQKNEYGVGGIPLCYRS